MKVIRCADGCGARVTVARTDDVPTWLGVFFTALNVGELSRAGFMKDGGQWRCRHCTRRRLFMRSVPAEGDVTAPTPPTGEKK